jgi:hypothetical protein
MFAHVEDNESVQGFEHLLRSFDFDDQLDEIASADPPSYLRRCFAEGRSAPHLTFARLQQLAACAIVVDAVLHDRAYEVLEPELVADWRRHYLTAFAALREPAVAALERGLEYQPPLAEPEAAQELRELAHRLAGD